MLTKPQIRKKTIKCKRQFVMFHHAKNDMGLLPTTLACSSLTREQKL